MKKIFKNTLIIISLIFLLSVNYIFLKSLSSGIYLVVSELILITLGLVGYFIKHKIVYFWWSVYMSYLLVVSYALIIYFSNRFIPINCNLFCFAPTLVLIQYLFFMPLFSIPLFNLLFEENKKSLRFRNNYKIFIIVAYIFLIMSIYLTLR